MVGETGPGEREGHDMRRSDEQYGQAEQHWAFMASIKEDIRRRHYLLVIETAQVDHERTWISRKYFLGRPAIQTREEARKENISDEP